MSTERTLRDAIVAAIAGKVAELGLENANTINDRLLGVVHTERTHEFLWACTTENCDPDRIRAWGVQVVAFDNLKGLTSPTNKCAIRTYQIAIEGYYDVDDVNLMIDHARVIRGALLEIGEPFGGSIPVLNAFSTGEPFTPTIAESGEFVSMRMDWNTDEVKRQTF